MVWYCTILIGTFTGYNRKSSILANSFLIPRMKRLIEILTLLLHLISLTLVTSQEWQCPSADPATCTSPTASGNTDASGLPPDFVDPCQDQNPDCHGWSVEGGCRAKPDFMKMTCPLSCGICKPIKTTASINDEKGAEHDQEVNELCSDQDENCAEFAADGECLINPNCECAVHRLLSALN